MSKNKIAFLVSGERMVETIRKYIDDRNVLIVETSISNALEEAQKLVESNVKVILTKYAIKIKIEDEISIPILSIENNISDYIALLKNIDVKNNKVAFVDYIEAPQSLVSLAEIISKDIIFKTFTSEAECREIIRDLKNKSYSTVVGSILTKKYANEFGIKSYEVETSEDSILMYLDIAEQIIKFMDLRKSKEKVLANIEIMIDEYLRNEEKLEKNVLDKVGMNDVEKNKLIAGLKRNAFSLHKTAEYLGISRTTLWRRLKKFNITIE